MKKIVKLDEYLEKNKHNMVRAAADALAIDGSEVLELWKDREQEVMQKAQDAGENPQAASHELERELLAALSVDSSDDAAAEAAVERVRQILAPRDVDVWENAFNGADTAGGYNLRFHVPTEAVKNKFMDWLEEQGEQYLINTHGDFAIRCENKDRTYRISRQLEHFKNRWDRPSAGKNVDPQARIVSLKDYDTKKALEGTVVSFPQSKTPSTYPNDPYVPTRADRARGMDSAAFFDFCYSTLFQMAVNGDGGGDVQDMLDQVESEVGREISPYQRANLKAKLEDELGEQIQQFAWRKGTVKPRVVQGGQSISEAKNKKTKPARPRDPNWRDNLARRQSGAAGAHSPGKYGKGERKQGKQDIQKAMESLVRDFVAEVAEKFDNDHRQMLPYMITFLRDSVEMTDTLAATVVTESIKNHHRIDERVSGVMGAGITGLQSLGRMRELAGISMSMDSSGDQDHGETSVIVEPENLPPSVPNTQQPRPTQVQTSQTHDLATAIDTMKCALEVFKSLDRPSQKAFKAYVTDALMGDCGEYTVPDGGQLMAILGEK